MLFSPLLYEYIAYYYIKPKEIRGNIRSKTWIEDIRASYLKLNLLQCIVGMHSPGRIHSKLSSILPIKWYFRRHHKYLTPIFNKHYAQQMFILQETARGNAYLLYANEKCVFVQDRLSLSFFTKWSSADPLRRCKQTFYCHFQRAALNTPNPWHLTM